MANQFVMTRKLRSEFAGNAHVCYQTGKFVEPAGDNKYNTSQPIDTLRRNDVRFSQLYFLSLTTARFVKEYLIDREQAIADLSQDLLLLQHLYDGTNPATSISNAPGKTPAVMHRLMDLNSHLVREVDFDSYNNAEKINLLIRLQRAVTIIQKRRAGTA